MPVSNLPPFRIGFAGTRYPPGQYGLVNRGRLFLRAGYLP